MYTCVECDFDVCPTCYLEIYLGHEPINYERLAHWMQNKGNKRLLLMWSEINNRIYHDENPDSDTVNVKKKIRS